MFDGKTVFKDQKPNNLSANSKVGIGTGNDFVDLRNFEVKRLNNMSASPRDFTNTKKEITDLDKKKTEPVNGRMANSR